MADSRPSTLFLVSCVSRKLAEPSPARDLYVSDWFLKARALVESSGHPWRILSANYGLVNPDTVIEPYELSLNTMGVAARRAWADGVLNDLVPQLAGVDTVVILAGQRYREFLIDGIWAAGAAIQVPMQGLAIGEQLAWLKRKLIGSTRVDHLAQFYAALDELEQRLGGKRTLAECHGRQGWPTRGLYFIFEPGEERSDSGTGPRVVRVGTHALKTGSKATLWNRLSQHQGVQKSGGGNHRASVFRLLIGKAVGARDEVELPTWGVDGSAGAAARRFSLTREEVTESEFPREREVSRILRAMPFLWLEIDDEPGRNSHRGLIERNAIALLSNYDKPPLDPPSPNWLGMHSHKEKVRRSGLWNSDHVEKLYDPHFLTLLEQKIKAIS